MMARHLTTVRKDYDQVYEFYFPRIRYEVFFMLHANAGRLLKVL